MDTILSKTFDILPVSDPECCSECGFTCYTMAENIIQGKAKRSDCVLDGNPDLKLRIGGKELVIVPFVQKILRDAILSMVDNLKDIDPKGKISIEIRRD